jgi:CBS domain-containing protein
MVLHVTTVDLGAGVQELADIIFANRVSAVPVVGEHGELVGIVSESDLVRHFGTGIEHRLEPLTGNQPLAAGYVRSHSRKVADVMTREVITATPDMPVRDVAVLLAKNDVRQVPIVRERKLVGIVSRTTLVQTLATMYREVSVARATSDSMIREDLMTRLDAEPWFRFSAVNVIVQDGAVALWGIVHTDTEKRKIRILAEATAGVRSIHDNLLLRPTGHHAESGSLVQSWPPSRVD